MNRTPFEFEHNWWCGDGRGCKGTCPVPTRKAVQKFGLYKRQLVFFSSYFSILSDCCRHLARPWEWAKPTSGLQQYKSAGKVRRKKNNIKHPHGQIFSHIACRCHAWVALSADYVFSFVHSAQRAQSCLFCLSIRSPESIATLTSFGPIEWHKWFFQISSQWESQKNRFAFISFGKIQFLPPCIWDLPFMSYRLCKM